MEKEVFIKLENISKTFGPVKANRNINLELRKGEIHALLGENGSGKSTLMNILSGIYSPDSGSILLDGKQVTFDSPKEAIEAGIGMVHQHFKLVDVLSAQENIIAGQCKGVFVNKTQMTESILGICKKYGLTVNPHKKIYNMSVSEKQTVEIIKVLYRGAKVLILDEPTAVLTPQETRVLFEIMRNMKREGCAVVIITHKMNEVMEISDRVTVLRKGESIATIETASSTPEQLTELMVGKAIDLDLERAQVDPALVKEVLRVENLTVLNGERREAVSNMSFTLSGGEILGVAGIADSGQKELCEAITGMMKIKSGKVIFKGEDIVGLNPRDIIKRGVSLSFVPEDRLGMGLVAGMNIIDNVLLKSYQNMPGFFVDRKEGRKKAEEIVQRFDISTPGTYQIVKRLSGGNIQKVLLGREIDLDPELLITAYPVRGLDIGASYNIYDVLNQQKQKGVAVLFIGEDLDVLLGLCDRLMVIHNGKIMDIVDPKKITKDEVGMLMVGRRPEGGELYYD